MMKKKTKRIRHPVKIDFSQIYYIGRSKLRLDAKEVGRLTFAEFNSLFKAYQDTFSIESYLRYKGIGYTHDDEEKEELIEF